MDSFARGTFNVDYEARIDWERLRRDRVEKTQRHMKAEGIDALLLWQDENVRYLTSQRAIMLQYRSVTHYGVLLGQEAGPVLLTSGGEIDRVREAMPWVPHIEAIPHMTEPGLVENVTRNQILPHLEAFGADRGKVGIDAATFTMRRAFENALTGVAWVDGEHFMYLSRVQKLPDEVQALQEATAIADAVTQTGHRPRPRGRARVRGGGRGHADALPARGGIRPPGQPVRGVGREDVAADPFRHGQDHPPRRHRLHRHRRHVGGLLRRRGANGDLRKALPPPTGDLHRPSTSACTPGSSKCGPGTRTCRPPGRSSTRPPSTAWITTSSTSTSATAAASAPNEPPYVGEAATGAMEIEFQPDMVFAIEPLIWVPNVRGGGGVRVEDMIWVRENGPEYMSRAPYCEELLIR